MTTDAPRSAVPLHDVSIQAKLTRLEHLELLAIQQEQELATLQSKYSEALNYLGASHLSTKAQMSHYVHHR